MPQGITQTIWVDDLGDNPAMTHRPTGVMYKSRKFSHLTPAQWKFIEKHEEAHARYDSTDENFCDQYASDSYLSDGGSPKASVAALAKGLSFDSPEHKQRLIAQFLRAAEYDCHTNKNKKACGLLNTEMVPVALKFLPSVTGLAVTAYDQLSGFSGFDLNGCVTNCKKTFPHGPINQKKCIDACNAQAAQASELAKGSQSNTAAQFQALLAKASNDASLAALTTADTELAKMQFELEKQKLAMQARSGGSMSPLTIGVIAGVALLIIILMLQD